jgi:hypothetical protein
VLGAAVVAAFVAGSSDARAANECNGLDVCISVPGPWVTVPARGEVRWRLQCPQRDLIVGGTDAVLTDPGVDVSFLARVGAPVNPGISTRRAATFVGIQAHKPRVASFRPFLGCIPTSGGGGRETTSRAAEFPPGDPATTRVRTVRVRPGSTTVEHSCRPNERILSATHAVAFAGAAPPPAALLGQIVTRQRAGARSASVTVRIAGRPALVQLQLVCGRAA